MKADEYVCFPSVDLRNHVKCCWVPYRSIEMVDAPPDISKATKQTWFCWLEMISKKFFEIPSDGKVVGGQLDIAKDSYIIVVCSATFPEVQPGMMMEEIPMRYRASKPEPHCRFILGDEFCGLRKRSLPHGAECDKTFACCHDKFDNEERFGGPPKL